MEDQFFLILIRVLCTVFAHSQEPRHISVTSVLAQKRERERGGEGEEKEKKKKRKKKFHSNTLLINEITDFIYIIQSNKTFLCSSVANSG